MKTNYPKHSDFVRFVVLAIGWLVSSQVCSGSPVAPPPLPRTAEMAAVAKADGDFALRLYQELAKEQSDANLFFSPYSVSRALGIALEGAVGETAGQMGEVLGFPDAARASGAEADTRPWNMLFINQGQATLTAQFRPKDVPQAVRVRIQKLRTDLDAANARAHSLMKADKYREAQQAGDAAEKAAAELNKLLTDVDQYELSVAAALWLEKTFPFRKSFLSTIKTYYGGDAFPTDFRRNPEAARAQINGWVEERTKDRIQNLITPGALTPDTSLVITSAVYFKGQWSKPFEESATRDEDFTTAGGAKQPTPMMHQYNSANAKYSAFRGDGSYFDTPLQIPVDMSDSDASLYPDAEGFTMLELPYKGDKISMVILVPQSVDALNKLEQRLKFDDVQSWIAKLQQRTVQITIPKFKLEATYTLNDALRALGMARAFNNPLEKNGAQFGGIVDSADLAKQLYIGKVVHKTFVEVNEKGTEAAAATAVLMPMAAAAPPRVEMRPFVPIFRADKPFIFLIRHADSGSVLFFGRMVEPK